jgi:branched-chain amino acid transport system substrate-binding protein
MTFDRRHLLLGAIALAAAGAARAQPAELPVGVFNATTGVFAFGGVPIQNGARLALEEANRQGLPGGAKIRIIEADTAGDKGQTINLVNQFARRDKALLLLGPTTTLEATAGAPVANDLQIPMVSTASSVEVLASGPWGFKIGARAPDVMGFLGKYAMDKLAVRRVTFVFDQANEGYIAQKNALRDAMKAAGAVVVSEEGIQSSDSNFLALATKLAAQETDAIFIAAPGELSGNFFLQVRQAGVAPKVRFLGPPTLASQGFIKAGGKAVEGTYVIADYSAGNPSPLNTAFIAAYKAKYGSAPDNWAAMGYSAGLIGVQAIRNAGPNPDRAKVRAELAKLTKVPVVIGTGSWGLDADRNPSYGGAMLVVKDGAFATAP